MSDIFNKSEKISATQPYAALDLGSNSFHLLVAYDKPGRLHVVDKHREMVRLAEGVHESNELSVTVIDRAIKCLDRIGQRLRDVPSENIRVVGTNTLRTASNSQHFIDLAEAALGHRIEIISGREEARLIYLGVSHSLEDQLASRLVIDVGGGSTELILGRQFQPRIMESLHMGCVSMSNRFFQNGKIRSSNFDRAVDAARQEVEVIQQVFKAHGWDLAIGASGTLLSIHSVITEFIGEERITVNGLNKLRRLLIDSRQTDNIELPGINKERASVFPGGVAIVLAIMEELGVGSIVVSSGALREGLLHDLLGRVHAEDIREKSVDDLVSRFHVDLNHALRVAGSASDFFSQVNSQWQIDNTDNGNLLRWAAMLHEIGMDISHSSYQKHGGYLLEHMDLPGFSLYEQKRLATLVRSHRRKYNADEIGEDLLSNKLCVILRLAVVLHRSRTIAPFPSFAVSVNKGKLDITIPSKWLEAHPLTELDLQQEQEYLGNAPIGLSINKN